MYEAASRIIAKMRTAAASFMTVDESKVDYVDGSFTVAGDPEKAKSFSGMAMALWLGWDLPRPL